MLTKKERFFLILLRERAVPVRQFELNIGALPPSYLSSPLWHVGRAHYVIVHLIEKAIVHELHPFLPLARSYAHGQY